MKIIALGDTHGRDIWERIVKAEADADKIVFIGDYFDTKENISAAEQLVNFNRICDFKEANPDKVIMLLGNHDFHYLRGLPSSERYSGYQQAQWADIQEDLCAAIDDELIQMCFEHNMTMFSHAGVTKTWCEKWGINYMDGADPINALFKQTLKPFQFQGWDVYGDDPEQSCIWVRPASLEQDAIPGYTQVVGHTMQERMVVGNYIVLIDTLGTSKQYLQIVGDAFTPKKLEE